VTAVPSALWAGAITFVSVSTVKTRSASIPSYLNASLVHEYEDRTRNTVPSLRSTRGLFTYNVGEGLLVHFLHLAHLPLLLMEASVHAKLDNTRFTYYGRSYGVGASIGLLDDDILGDPLATRYVFQERGYNAQVTCIYNLTTDWTITQVSKNNFRAQEFLPNSASFYYADYFGYGSTPMVAIGVAPSKTDGRILGIATGLDQAFLNTTQCSIDFQPTLFNITVGTIGRNITVTPVSHTGVEDIELLGNLSFTAIRQFLLISTDQTGLYTCLVGISFNNSIGDYNLSLANADHEPVSEANVTIAGLQNSITAKTDDILGAYAAAQTMVARSTSNTTGTVDVLAFKFGEDAYIYAVVVMNVVILMVVLVEAWRTRGWKELGELII
jgi:hypothetical protein